MSNLSNIEAGRLMYEAHRIDPKFRKVFLEPWAELSPVQRYVWVRLARRHVWPLMAAQRQYLPVLRITPAMAENNEIVAWVHAL